MSTEAAALRRFLQAQRDSVVAVMEGLDDDLASAVVVPTGWSLVDLVDHLRGAEQHWFAHVVSGRAESGDDPFYSGLVGRSRRSVRDVVRAYQEQCTDSNQVIATHGLDEIIDAPVPDQLVHDVRDLRGVLLHMIEETARHAGHLDVARELIDGRVGLGPR
jgi:uncharacterized damage-inducible protein DinB